MFYERCVTVLLPLPNRIECVVAGRQRGSSRMQTIIRPFPPASCTTAMVYKMTNEELGVALGSGLGYLGLGAQPPAAEWGVQIADGKNFMTTAWWISVFPGLAIIVTGLGFSLVGDGLAELLRTRK